MRQSFYLRLRLCDLTRSIVNPSILGTTYFRYCLARFYCSIKDDELTATSAKSSLPSSPNHSNSILVSFSHGLPFIVVPLPSRQELCQFTLKPVSDTVGSLCENLKKEDHGIEIAALYTSEGTRISQGTNIQHLLLFKDFRLRINDTYFNVSLPVDHLHWCDQIKTGESMKSFDDLKAKIASLYTIFNIDDFKVEREKFILSQLEDVKTQLRPMEIMREKINGECERHSRRILWSSFFVMGLQTGIFARLTWYEYSWDIMEPVTYFATFSTVFATFGYYLLTNQNFEYSSVHRQLFSREFYRRAKVYHFDIYKYNELCELCANLKHDLARIRDPLSQHLPANRFSALQTESAKIWLKSATSKF